MNIHPSRKEERGREGGVKNEINERVLIAHGPTEKKERADKRAGMNGRIGHEPKSQSWRREL